MTQNDQSMSMIIVMGVTGTGKSSFINHLAGRPLVEVGHTLHGCTQKCAAVPANIGNSKVLLVDTPGFDDAKRTDSDILTEISKLLAFQYEAGVKLKGAIYLQRINDPRYTGSGVKTLRIFKEIVGEAALHNVILVTNRWNEIDEAKGADNERVLREEYWQYMLAKGSTLARFHGTEESAVSLASLLLSKNDVVLEIQHELVDEGKTLGQTAAGSLVNEDLTELKAQHEREIAELKAMQETLRDNDRQLRKQLERDWAREEQRMRAAKDDEARLRSSIAAEVRAEVAQEKKKRRSGLERVLPFVPSVLSVIGLFVGIPPGTFETLTSWLGASGIGDSFAEFLNF